MTSFRQAFPSAAICLSQRFNRLQLRYAIGILQTQPKSLSVVIGQCDRALVWKARGSSLSVISKNAQATA
jgi:hypothetical protein